MSIISNLNTSIKENEGFVAPQVKRSFYRVSHVPTGKKGKMRWIFNPSKFVRPFQQTSLSMLYLFNETLDPVLAGCIPESSLPDKVACMYGAASIYVSDIKGFFKNTNRTVLYRAVDRMLYKYIYSHAAELIRRNQAHESAEKLGVGLLQEDREKLLHVKGECLTYFTNAATMLGDIDAYKLRLIATKESPTLQWRLKWPRGYTLRLGRQDARAEHYKEDLPSLYSNKAPEVSAIIDNLLINMFTVLVAGRNGSVDAWEDFQKECPDDCTKVTPVSLIDALNGAMLKVSKEERKVILDTEVTTSHISGAYEDMLLTLTESVRERIELMRRIMHFIVDAGTTHLNTLPEGAATSPMLANILLDSVADDIKTTFRHTPENMIVYMDDISMSYSVPLSNAMTKEISEDFDKVLNKYGLKRHPKKTKIYNTKGRRRVLGINITDYKGPSSNISIRVPRHYRRGMRVVLHRFEKFIKAYDKHLDTKPGMSPDKTYVEANYPEGYTSKSHFSIKSRIREINGKLSWMKCVSPLQAAPYANKITDIKKKYFGKIQGEVTARSIGLIDLKLVPK